RALTRYNKGKTYTTGQIRPFNFALLVTEELLRGDDREPRRFIGGFTKNPDAILSQRWYDLDSPDAEPVAITTDYRAANDSTVLVQSMEYVLYMFVKRFEVKKVAADRKPANANTVGLMFPRQVKVAEWREIGK